MTRALRKIREPIEALLHQAQGFQVKVIYVCLLSYLDDLTLVLPTAIAEDAIPVLQEELKAVGLSVNAEKTLCWSPSGQQPPGTCVGMLWNNSARHDGMILCGCPFEGVLTLDDSDNMDLDSAIPIGTPAFIDTFLASARIKSRA